MTVVLYSTLLLNLMEELAVVMAMSRLASLETPASVLKQVVKITASAVSVYVVVGAVTASAVTAARVVVGAVMVSVPVVAVTILMTKLVLTDVVEAVVVRIPRTLEQDGVASAEAAKALTMTSNAIHLCASTSGKVPSSSSDCTPGRAAAKGKLRRAEATTERVLLDTKAIKSMSCCCVVKAIVLGGLSSL